MASKTNAKRARGDHSLKSIRKVMIVGSSVAVTLPIELALNKGIRAGDHVKITWNPLPGTLPTFTVTKL